MRRALAGLLLIASALPASALDYRSVASNAVLYDAPSTKAKPLFIINAGTPVEAVLTADAMVKVRDMQGTLAWIEKKSLADKRTVLIRTDRAQVRAQADEKAALVFEAERDVVLDLVEVPAAGASSGWLRVRHRDGASGFVKVAQVWGL